MKIKITLTDGTVIKAEGTAAECSEFAQLIAPQSVEQAEAPPISWPAPGQQVFPWVDPWVPTRIPETSPYVPWQPDVIGPYVYPATTPYFVPNVPFAGSSGGGIRIGSSVQLCDNIGGDVDGNVGVSLTNVSISDITSGLFS